MTTKTSRNAALALMLTAALACARRTTTPMNETAGTAATTTTAASGPTVIFPDGTPIHVELATDDETRAQGLMYRDRVRPGTGMLFLFAQSGVYPFWMKNTLVPLDMIWIDEAQKIVDIAHDVPPCKAEPCPSYPAEGLRPARYVLEVAAGVAKQHGLAPGAQLRLEHLEGVPVR